MKLKNLLGLMVAGALVFASCKKDDDNNNGGGGNNNTAGTIASLNCAGAAGPSAINGVSFEFEVTVPYTGGVPASYAEGTPVQSTGITGLTATLLAGNLEAGDGDFTYRISGIANGVGTANFAISFAGKSCTLSIPVVENTPPSITSLGCANASLSGGQAVVGNLFNGSVTVPYTGGNGGYYSTGSAIASTGVTGLNATLVGNRTLAVGAGSVIFNISGTPTTAGPARFEVSIGGQTCTLTLTVQPPPPYIGRWNYQFLRDSIYNWDEAINNDNFVLDSVRTFDLTSTQGYFEFNTNNTYKWQDSRLFTGSYTSSRTNYGYGIVLKCLGISTRPAPNDTTRFYIYTLNSQNMTLNRDYLIGVNSNNDTFVIDRYYDLLKQ